MIASHYVYDDKGRILLTHQGKRRQIEHNMKAGSLVTLKAPCNVEGTKHYHNDGNLTDRPTITVPDAAVMGVSIAISGIPAGVNIKVNKEVIAVSDGTDLDLTFDLDGDYEIEITPPFPFVPVKKIIKATP